jgi:hypothetical protein
VEEAQVLVLALDLAPEITARKLFLLEDRLMLEMQKFMTIKEIQLVKLRLLLETQNITF